MKPAVYTMPRRPIAIAVKRRVDFDKIETAPLPEIVAVDKFTECHVTPPDVAARMVRYLGEHPGRFGRVLEPSAGTGNLSRALISHSYCPSQIVQVERHISLSQSLRDLGCVVNKCFLEYVAAQCPATVLFERIVMNPPFSDVRKHISAALSLLGRKGVLVALVPITFQRDGMETLEHLPDDTFSTAKVRTKIIRISN